MTKEEVEAFKAREKAATLGPWAVDTREIEHSNGVSIDHFVGMPGESIGLCWRGDASFIAPARADVPALLAYVAELKAKAHNLAGERDFAFRKRHIGNGCGK